jgi:serine protease
MAAPHVAGVGALLMSWGLSNVEAWNAMTGTAKDLGNAGFDTLYGYGRVDALAALPMR